MKYKIALTSVIWSPDYRNVRRFGSRTDQQTYFNVNTLFTNLPERNLNGGTFYNISINFKTGETGLENIMSANYAIIKDLAVQDKYYYYFIQNVNYDSVGQIRVDLIMDVFQTFYLDITFGESMIERAHLNRWTQILTDYKFSNSINSPFYARDEIRGLSKRVANQTVCTTSPWSPANTLTAWLNENVGGWIYAYLDKDTYNYDNDTSSAVLVYDKEPSSGNQIEMDSPYFVVYCPLYLKSSSKITINGKELSLANFFEFLQANMAHVYNIKVTQFTPWCRANAPTATSTSTTLDITAYSNTTMLGTSKYVGVLTKQYLKTQYLSKAYTLPQASITKANIDTYAKDLAANPKIYNTDYRELKVVYGGGEYSFDIQKLYGSSLTTQQVWFDCFEILTPEISPTFISIIPTSSEPIYQNTRLNRIGYLTENDLTIPYSKNQLDVFLANNKNFFKMKEAQYTLMRAQRLTSSFSQMAGGAAGAAGAAIAGDIGGAIKTGVMSVLNIGLGALENEMAIYTDKQIQSYTLDNMQSGVDALANSNSNTFFTLALTDTMIILQELEALPIDMGRALEDMHENGYIYHRMGNIKDFDNIRSKWNYVKAMCEYIKTPTKIPNIVRDTIRNALANGVRFWNTDTWDYTQTNLEN